MFLSKIAIPIFEFVLGENPLLVTTPISSLRFEENIFDPGIGILDFLVICIPLLILGGPPEASNFLKMSPPTKSKFRFLIFGTVHDSPTSNGDVVSLPSCPYKFNPASCKQSSRFYQS
eukprot:GHVP01065022.1.p1 GENE.GHVP01065022.1~~GHVP01065022.1.p1  ORF type:complete len:118 (+),score=20.12 GHVP01065022.1:996-1349(+)